MFGKRSDGTRIKSISGFERMGSLIIGKTRVECTNFMSMDIITEKMDEYIKEKRAEGIEYTYRDIIIATLVRVFHLRPRLNRFVYGGVFYQRKHIDVSMVIHKSLKTGELETQVKCRFSGLETINEIKNAFDAKVKEATSAVKANNTDVFTSSMNWMPAWLIRIVAGFMRFADRHGMLSDKFWFETSPFHASIFVADLKSIHLDAILHHLYNFGNCGFFCAIGKEKMKSIIDDESGALKAKRVLELGIAEDERFIDGLYYSNVVKLVRRIIDNLSCLERVPEEDEIKKNPLPNRNKDKKKRGKKAKEKKKKWQTSPEKISA